MHPNRVADDRVGGPDAVLARKTLPAWGAVGDAGAGGDDPTHDFDKNTWHGLELLRHCDRLVATGWPVLMALSHKDFVGETLDVDLDGRFEGTLAATAIAAWSGAHVFRAHDVRATRRALEMVAAVAGTRAPACTVRGLA